MRLHGIGQGILLGAAAGLAALTIVASYAATPDQIIAERRDSFKHQGDLFKAMHDGIDSGADVKQFAAGAAYIADWAGKFPAMFPPGTETGGGTHALPAIWQDKAGFDKLAAQLKVEATKLQQVAETGDKAAFAAQFKATGGVCGECHRTYRAKL
jgi:cytochrome c556